MSANRGRADSGFATGAGFIHSELGAASAGVIVPHPGKPKILKVPPEKYDHINPSSFPKTHLNPIIGDLI